MKKPRASRAVALGTLPVLAGLVAGCGDYDEQAYCVNSNDQVVDNRYCGDDHSGGGAGYFFYYGGHALGGGQVRAGTRLTGGGANARVPSTNKPAITSRGGFGGSARPGSIGATAHGSSGGS
jgi:hypothetical protein